MTQNDAPTGAGRTILVSGASGFVGSYLCDHLLRHQWRVRRLVRRAPRDATEVTWEPERSWLNDAALEGVYGVVHLAGESVNGRWSEEKKRRISKSRVDGTRTLARAIRGAAEPPAVFVSASAIGYYGDRGDEELSETSSSGGDFLAEVCRAWEEESQAVGEVCRRVNPRIGIVLGDGGALEQMAKPVRWGLGGKLGDGQQWVSWISLLDLVRLLTFSLSNDTLRGPVNAVAPTPVTNAELTRELARLLNRPDWLTVPKAALKVALGEFADEVLSSKRVVPHAAAQAGFEWRHTNVTSALRWALGVEVNG